MDGIEETGEPETPSAAVFARIAVVTALAQALSSKRRRRLLERIEAIALDWERQAGVVELRAGPRRQAIVAAQAEAATGWLRPTATLLRRLYPAGD